MDTKGKLDSGRHGDADEGEIVKVVGTMTGNRDGGILWDGR